MVHPWHCPPDCPRHSDTSSYFTSSTRANLSSWSWQTTHLCVNGLSEEREEGQKWERGGAERGKSRRKCGSEEDTSHHRLLKGHILFEGSHTTLHSTSRYPSHLHLCQLTPLSNWTAHCPGLSYITAPYTASVKWKRIKELKEWIEKVDLQKFILPHKTVASRAVKGHVHDDQLVDDGPAWHLFLKNIYWLNDTGVFVSVEQTRRPFRRWDWWGYVLKYGRATDEETLASCVHMFCAHINAIRVCGCAYMHAYMSRQQVCIYKRLHVCVQASISVYFCSPKPTRIWMQETGHISLLCEPLDSAVRIF